MTIHELKLQEGFCDEVFNGNKNFEIRFNDRGYQKGDMIKFTPVDRLGVYTPHSIEKCTYMITYVLGGYGLKENYVVLGIREYVDG